jgi:hypothetical protein
MACKDFWERYEWDKLSEPCWWKGHYFLFLEGLCFSFLFFLLTRSWSRERERERERESSSV